MDKKTGGPAFPGAFHNDSDFNLTAPDGQLVPPDGSVKMHGMTLRDYFAAKAMQGMMAVPDDQRYGDRADKTLTVEQWQAWCVTGLVEHAYRVADAMLKAREA